LQLVYSAAVGDRSKALRLEYRIKRLDRSDKEALIHGQMTLQNLGTDQGPAAG